MYVCVHLFVCSFCSCFSTLIRRKYDLILLFLHWIAYHPFRASLPQHGGATRPCRPEMGKERVTAHPRGVRAPPHGVTTEAQGRPSVDEDPKDSASSSSRDGDAVIILPRRASPGRPVGAGLSASGLNALFAAEDAAVEEAIERRQQVGKRNTRRERGGGRSRRGWKGRRR